MKESLINENQRSVKEDLMEVSQKESIYYTAKGISSLEVARNKRMRSLTYEHLTFKSKTQMMNSTLEV